MATKTDTKSKSMLRRSALAYVGLYGMAYDRAVMRRQQAQELTANLLETLSEKGEAAAMQAELVLKKVQSGVLNNYAQTADKVKDMIPVTVKTKVDRLEDELADLQAQFERMSKAAKPAKKRKAVKAAVKPKASKPVVKKAAKPVVAKTVEVKAPVKPAAEKPVVMAAKTEAPTAPKVDAKAEAVAPKAEAKTETKVETKPANDTPRHIPYLNDVKRYDPLADEDIVRKIVNHCGIALASEDGRCVACSDESERATVRDSWLKKKLGIEADDKTLDKAVMDVCGLMQRDQKKNRVTFYYLLAKKERKLDTL